MIIFFIDKYSRENFSPGFARCSQPQGKPLSLSMATRPPEGPKGKSGGDCGKSCGGLGNNI